MIVRESPFSAAVTHDRILHEVAAAGNTLFADLDQAELSRRADTDLRPTYVVIFGNPRAGAAIMNASALAGYELPLKLMIWSEGEQTRIAYRPPSAMRDEYGLEKLDGVLNAMDATVASIIERATAP